MIIVPLLTNGMGPQVSKSRFDHRYLQIVETEED
jgi:hypothetical protein